MAKYTTYHAGNKIIVVSRFAGKPVRGVAKCDPMDTFDPEFGEQLAKARCDVKVAEKRHERACRLLVEAFEQKRAAEARIAKMDSYVKDAASELFDAENLVENLEVAAGMKRI